MLSVSNLSVQFGKRILFDEVNTKFLHGNCYGIIGANGAGKSTFLKIISGVQDPTSGQVHLEKGKRMSVLTQDHYAFDEFPVLETVVMGNKDLFKIKKQIDALYADYTDENAEKIGELQITFEEMDGWNADSNAAAMLSNLGITEDIHYTLMKDLDGKQKVRVLIAQALFGNPDVLIMDEPTNDLDFETITWLENFLANFENTVIVVSHDREFLDGLTNRIWEIEEQQLKVHHYGVKDFLSRKTASFEKKINVTSVKKDVVIETNESEQKLTYQEEKARKRLKNKLQNQVNKSEQKIDELESKIAEQDLIIADLNYDDKAKAESILSAYNTLKAKLDEQMSLWEEGTEGLMEMEG